MPFDLPPPLVIHAPAPASSRGQASFTRGTPEGTFATLPRTLTVALPFAGLADADALAEVEVSARAWSEVSCTSVRFAIAGAGGAAATAGDGRSTLVFHTSDWPAELVPRALAQTVLVVDGGGHITDADVHVNGKDHRFTVDGAEGSSVDLRSVLVHELGHALGLGHSLEPAATMAPTVSGLRARTLERDDEAGVCALYPGESRAARCSQDGGAPCPTGFVCLAGACERRGTPRTTCAPCRREEGACDGAGAESRCVDVDQGASRVCAPRCDAAHPCGLGFTCTKTTSAGDEQCVSDDGCRTLGPPCASDRDCGEFLCRAGRCVGPGETPVDAGTASDAGRDATSPPPSAELPVGCASAPSTQRSPSGACSLGLLLAFFVGLTRRARKTRPR